MDKQVTIIPDHLLSLAKQPEIVVIPDNDQAWAYGEKTDPTQFCPSTSTIQVKESFDLKNDPEKWMVHERVHAMLHALGVDQYANKENPYPTNTVEQWAFKTQFFHLIKEGVSIEQIKTDPKFETLKKSFQHSPEVLVSYFHEAKDEWNRQNESVKINDPLAR